tara:strand:+ start:44 stop:352 length:309 start_codon:yes stop_codon:yes gene_type:complete
LSSLARHYLISGRVQGVGFRNYTKKKATQMGVIGWVRNLEDGRVEALVCGDEPALTRLDRYISHGPELAVVESVERCDVDKSVIEVDTFTVEQTGEAPWQQG